MARTNAYKSQIKNTAGYVNKKIRDIENLFGIGSEQYSRYVNAVTAALPVGSYSLSESGKVRIKTGKASQEILTKGELRPLVNLPTAKASMKAAKASMAKNNLQLKGVESPTAKEIADEAITISDMEALQELDDKSYIQDRENSKGKLRYDASVRGEMAAKGRKSYSELRKIVEKGEQNRREKRNEYQRRYREKHREEVNQKQREYRARRRAEGR